MENYLADASQMARIDISAHFSGPSRSQAEIDEIKLERI
jgi:hypothetical protein